MIISYILWQTSVPDLWRYINAQKLLRYNLPASALTPEAEVQRATHQIDAYLEGLRLGKDLPSYELQHSDDLAILAAQAFVNAWKQTGDDSHLFNAASVPEYAISRGKMSYQVRLHLIWIYHLLGAPLLAPEHHRCINLKQVQSDTLSHLMPSRASTFSPSLIGDLTYTIECVESSRIYLSNSEKVGSSDTCTTADHEPFFFLRLPNSSFVHSSTRNTLRYEAPPGYHEPATEIPVKIPDFIIFEDRLDNSLQRDLIKMEHVRMRIAHEQVDSELVDMELIELKLIFDRCTLCFRHRCGLIRC